MAIIWYIFFQYAPACSEIRKYVFLYPGADYFAGPPVNPSFARAAALNPAIAPHSDPPFRIVLLSMKHTTIWLRGPRYLVMSIAWNMVCVLTYGCGPRLLRKQLQPTYSKNENRKQSDVSLSQVLSEFHILQQSWSEALREHLSGRLRKRKQGWLVKYCTRHIPW